MDTSLAIALAATKGGCGKSSLCTSLAVHASEGGAKVGMLDLDPQGSLPKWWHLRGKPDNPKLYTGIEVLAEDVALLKKIGCQYIFIDTPPGNADAVNEAIEAADFVVIPSRVSAFDILAVEPTAQACKSMRKPFGFVLNAYDPKWKLSASAGPVLADLGPVLPPPIEYRAAYASALTLGRTGPESQNRAQARECRAEIAALWQSILKAAQ